MIARLFGTILEWEEEALILRAGAVGYRVFLSPCSHAALSGAPFPPEELALFTQFFWSEHQDTPTLIGFPLKEEQDLFLLLRKVQGLGPMTALRILSLPVPDMLDIISRGDIARLKTLKGVGEKTARKIVSELKGEVPSPNTIASIPMPHETGSPSTSPSDIAGMVREALVRQFGHSPQEASRLVSEALRKRPGISTIEELFMEVYRNGSD